MSSDMAAYRGFVGTGRLMAAPPGPMDNNQSVQLIGAMGRMEGDRFLADSFGFAQPQLRNSMRSVLADSGSLLLVVAEDELQPRQRYIDGRDQTLPDIQALLTAMAANRRLLSMAQLSALLTPRFDLQSRHWDESFNIVVGDAVVDRVIYWNARGLMSPWRDGTNVDLCIPRARFDDPAFIGALRGFLNRRNHVNGSSGNGPCRATLRSASLSAEELAPLAEQMRDGQCWIIFDSEHVASVSECVPEASSLENPFLTVGQHGLRSPNPWSESFSDGNEIRLTAPEPEHVRYVPTSLVNPSSGVWAVDIDIERTVDHSPYSNVKHRWRLPRRLRVTSAFCQHYQPLGDFCEFVGPRVSARGLLTLFTAGGATLPKITVPTDHGAIVRALQRGRGWSPADRSSGHPPLIQPCFEARRSNAGRYFWGVYQLFGDMNVARSVLLHEFWRKQLEDFEATDQRTDIRQERIKAKLRRRIGSHTLDLSNEDQLGKLSDIVLQESDAVRMTVRSLNWDHFQNDFRALAAQFDAGNMPSQPQGQDIAEEDRQLIDPLRSSVNNLCNLGILHQGYEHKCRKCLYRSWISISDLKPDIVCGVCHDVQPAPVDESWQFRLNGFLREALQRHGIGPLFWVLSRFQRHSSNSFWFDGPLDIYFDQEAADAGRPATDIDLTMIIDGIVHMCEVKQSERGFSDPVLLAQTMARLRPDVAMIAVMEADSPALQRKFAQFSATLEGTGIRPQLLTLHTDNDISADPYF